MLFCCFEAFLVKFTENYSEILSKFVFLNKVENGQDLRKIWICLNNFFFINPVKGDKY